MDIVFSKCCRLCLEDPEAPGISKINILQRSDVRALVEHLYGIAINENDLLSKFICFNCYKESADIQKFSVLYTTKKPMVAMNQEILLNQATAISKNAEIIEIKDEILDQNENVDTNDRGIPLNKSLGNAFRTLNTVSPPPQSLPSVVDSNMVTPKIVARPKTRLFSSFLGNPPALDVLRTEYSCDKCTDVFATKETLFEHKNTRHKHKCSFCNKDFAQENTYIEHLTTCDLKLIKEKEVKNKRLSRTKNCSPLISESSPTVLTRNLKKKLEYPPARSLRSKGAADPPLPLEPNYRRITNNKAEANQNVKPKKMTRRKSLYIELKEQREMIEKSSKKSDENVETEIDDDEPAKKKQKEHENKESLQELTNINSLVGGDVHEIDSDLEESELFKRFYGSDDETDVAAERKSTSQIEEQPSCNIQTADIVNVAVANAFADKTKNCRDPILQKMRDSPLNLEVKSGNCFTRSYSLDVKKNINIIEKSVINHKRIILQKEENVQKDELMKKVLSYICLNQQDKTSSLNDNMLIDLGDKEHTETVLVPLDDAEMMVIDEPVAKSNKVKIVEGEKAPKKTIVKNFITFDKDSVPPFKITSVSSGSKVIHQSSSSNNTAINYGVTQQPTSDSRFVNLIAALNNQNDSLLISPNKVSAFRNKVTVTPIPSKAASSNTVVVTPQIVATANSNRPIAAINNQQPTTPQPATALSFLDAKGNYQADNDKPKVTIKMVPRITPAEKIVGIPSTQAQVQTQTLPKSVNITTYKKYIINNNNTNSANKLIQNFHKNAQNQTPKTSPSMITIKKGSDLELNNISILPMPPPIPEPMKKVPTIQLVKNPHQTNNATNNQNVTSQKSPQISVRPIIVRTITPASTTQTQAKFSYGNTPVNRTQAIPIQSLMRTLPEITATQISEPTRTTTAVNTLQQQQPGYSISVRSTSSLIANHDINSNNNNNNFLGFN